MYIYPSIAVHCALYCPVSNSPSPCVLTERVRAQEVGAQVMKLRKEIENERGQLHSKQSAVEEENAALRSRMQQSQQEHMDVVQQLRNAGMQVEI